MQLEEIDVRMSVGDFVLKRPAELGARYLFGVPGDYNLWFFGTGRALKSSRICRLLQRAERGLCADGFCTCI
jgi:hypothetical protein